MGAIKPLKVFIHQSIIWQIGPRCMGELKVVVGECSSYKSAEVTSDKYSIITINSNKLLHQNATRNGQSTYF